MTKGRALILICGLLVAVPALGENTYWGAGGQRRE